MPQYRTVTLTSAQLDLLIHSSEMELHEDWGPNNKNKPILRRAVDRLKAAQSPQETSTS